ncbi:MAG: hypothetical protein ACXQTN_04580 [Methanoculleaceae archaeon]
MRRGRFARDWEVVRLTRRYQPPGIAGSILRHLMGCHDASVIKAVCDAARAAGHEHGEEFRGRVEKHPDPLTVVEAILLMSGIPAGREDGEEGTRLVIDIRSSSIFSGNSADVQVVAAYIEGFVSSIIPNVEVKVEEERLVVRVGDGRPGG